jgi:hypothetical protein
MRKALSISEAAVFTVPTEKLSWVKLQPRNAFFVPVGANLPSSRQTASVRKNISIDEKLSIAVFGITGGGGGRYEI